MENRLRQLKKAIDQTAFKQVAFTDQHQQQIRKQLQTTNLTQTILSMLMQPKTGVELTQLLHVRKTSQIIENEGLVYSILHEAENNGWLHVNFDQEKKYYEITKLGKKQLQREKGTEKLSLKEKVFGVRMHAE